MQAILKLREAQDRPRKEIEYKPLPDPPQTTKIRIFIPSWVFWFSLGLFIGAVFI